MATPYIAGPHLVDGDEDHLDQEADEPHRQEAHRGQSRHLGELLLQEGTSSKSSNGKAQGSR